MDISSAKIGRQLSCSDGTFCNPGGTALNAQKIETSGSVFLTGEFTAEGEVSLSGVKISGELDCSGGTFRNPGSTALYARNIETSAGVFLAGGFVAEGTVWLASAKIGGELDLRRGVFKDKLVLKHAVVPKLVDEKKCRPKRGMLFLDGFQYEELADESSVGWEDRLVWLEWQEESVTWAV